MPIQRLKDKFASGKKPTGRDFDELIDATFNTPILEPHTVDVAPHQYGGKYEWRHNPITNSLDLVVLD